MKRILIATLGVFLLSGCFGPKFVIPDEPQFKKMQMYQFERGICFDNPDAEILKGNIEALKDYADKLRKILEGIRE